MTSFLSPFGAIDSVSNAGSGSGSGSGDGTDSMEDDDDDEDRERVKPSGGGGGHNNAHRGSSPVDSNRHQPSNKPSPYDGIAKNSVPSTDDDEDDEDDAIEFAPGGQAGTPKSDHKGPTSSSAPPADSTQQPLSPNKALTSYLVPIVVMWLGNMFWP